MGAQMTSLLGRALAALLSSFAVIGCVESVPVPPEGAAYVGEWQERSMQLIITPDGRVHYKRVVDTRTTTVNGPLKGFTANGFEVGIGFLSTTFVVNSPPRQVNGEWKLTVDGVELTRTNEEFAVRAPKPERQPLALGQMLLALSPSDFQLAAAPALLFMLAFQAWLFAQASKRSGTPLWKYFVLPWFVGKTLTGKEKLLGVVSIAGGLVVFHLGAYIVLSLRHGT
jgi:hypothetical protein